MGYIGVVVLIVMRAAPPGNSDDLVLFSLNEHGISDLSSLR